MKYLFLYYPFLNILAAYIILLNCESTFASAIISSFNICTAGYMIINIKIMICIILNYIILEILRGKLLPRRSKIGRKDLLTKRGSNSISLIIFIWLAASLGYIILKLSKFDQFNVIGIVFILSAYVIPLVIYIRIFRANLINRFEKVSYFVVSLLCSVFLFTKLFMLYVFAFVLSDSSQRTQMKSLVLRLSTILIIGLVSYLVIQWFRSVVLYQGEFEIPDTSILLLKIMSRFLILDQITWCLNLVNFSSDNSVYMSLAELEERSRVVLYRIGFIENFGFSLSLFGPAYISGGYLAVTVYATALYLILGIMLRLLSLKSSSWFIFPIGLQIINNGFNYHTQILLMAALGVIVIFRLRILR